MVSVSPLWEGEEARAVAEAVVLVVVTYQNHTRDHTTSTINNISITNTNSTNSANTSIIVMFDSKTTMYTRCTHDQKDWVATPIPMATTTTLIISTNGLPALPVTTLLNRAPILSINTPRAMPRAVILLNRADILSTNKPRAMPTTATFFLSALTTVAVRRVSAKPKATIMAL